MKARTKIIIVAATSRHYFTQSLHMSLKQAILDNWPARTAINLKHNFPEIDVECWSAEKGCKETSFLKGGVIFRIFPTTFYVRYGLELSLPMIFALRRNAKERNTLIEIHEIHNFQGLLIPLLVKGNIIAQHHGGSNILEHGKRKIKLKVLYPFLLFVELLQSISIRKINLYFSLSEQETAYIHKRSTETKIIFQTMGIGDDYFKIINKKAARKQLGLLQNKKILLHLGRVSKLKGVQYVLEALKILNRKDIEYHIIGEGAEKEAFQKYALSNQINAVFHGYVSDEDKKLFLSAADALMLISNREGCPVVIMEALARNLPVISSDVGGIPQMIKNGKEGFVVRQGNVEGIVEAIRKMIRNPLKDVQKYAEQYRWKSIIDKRVIKYNSLLNK